jgi:hypothetical protein
VPPLQVHHRTLRLPQARPPVNCRRAICAQPVERCPPTCDYPLCQGWRHAAGLHHCTAGSVSLGDVAEPEPGQLPLTEQPTSKPEGEVA